MNRYFVHVILIVVIIYLPIMVSCRHQTAFKEAFDDVIKVGDGGLIEPELIYNGNNKAICADFTSYDTNGVFKYTDKFIDNSLKSSIPEDVKFIVMVESEKVEVGRYENGAVAYSIYYDVEIFELYPWKSVSQRWFEGTPPPRAIPRGSYGIGLPPNSNEIRDWIKKIILKEPIKDLSAGDIYDAPPPPPFSDLTVDTEVELKERNILTIRINSQDQILCENESVNLKQLREKVRTFVKNENDDENLPEKESFDIPFFGTTTATINHIIYLQKDHGTSRKMYLDVIKEIAAAYTDLRDEISIMKFGERFIELDREQKKAILLIYPQKIEEITPVVEKKLL